MRQDPDAPAFPDPNNPNIKGITVRTYVALEFAKTMILKSKTNREKNHPWFNTMENVEMVSQTSFVQADNFLAEGNKKQIV